MLEWLRRHGVDDVIMSCGFKAERMRDVLGDGSQYGLTLRFVEEPEPRGTAGALKYAEEHLQDRFLMLNGDVLTDIDLTAQIARTRRPARAARSPWCPWPTRPPTASSASTTTASVKEFVEKPSADQIDTNLISAGAYVLERDVVDLIAPDRNVSIEREVWPRLVGDGLYGFAADAYWLDIGTPDRYLQGTFDILEGNVSTAVASGWARATSRSPTARRARGASCRPRSSRAAATSPRAPTSAASWCSAGRDRRRRTRASSGAWCWTAPGSATAASSRLHRRAGVRSATAPSIAGGAVLGEGVTVGAGNVLSNGVKVFPHARSWGTARSRSEEGGCRRSTG